MKTAVSKNTQKKRNRISDRNKTLIQFLIIILISGLFGGFLSLAIGMTEGGLASLGSILEDFFIKASYILLPTVGFLLLIISFFCYKRQKKQVSALTGDDSDYDRMKEINQKLDRAICILSLNTVLSSILYGLGVSNFHEYFSPAKTLLLCDCNASGCLFTKKSNRSAKRNKS